MDINIVKEIDIIWSTLEGLRNNNNKKLINKLQKCLFKNVDKKDIIEYLKYTEIGK